MSAENQRRIAESLDKDGIMINPGWYLTVRDSETYAATGVILVYSSLKQKIIANSKSMYSDFERMASWL